MEIMKPLGPFFSILFLLFSPSLFAANLNVSPAESDDVTGSAVIHEINVARQDPGRYASFLEQTRQNYAGRIHVMSGNILLRTHEGVRAVDEAIRFLRSARPLPALALSPGLSLAAADHCREQVSGTVGHRGQNGSDPGSRISRYGVAAQGWAENIAYGQRTARSIVMALIIDDGVRSRGHRKNIFSPNYTMAGAAYGPHGTFGSVCSIDFAAVYAERRLARVGTDAASF
jgi:uncharacterized protein YkwD